nr:unnamed protein product [Callosobruchus chinensis]
MAQPDGYMPLCDLDWTDMTLYQHPPCMFTLWWMGLFVNAIWDPIKALLTGEGGGEGKHSTLEIETQP